VNNTVSSRKTIERWQVGGDSIDAPGIVALTARQLDYARTHADVAVSFVQATAVAQPKAPHVQVVLPPYRGKRLVLLLSWLVTEHLAEHDAEVSWVMAKQQGPDSILCLLRSCGWKLVKERVNGLVCLRGSPPPHADQPEPQSFIADLGARPEVTMVADYGVFSPNRIDDGTKLLMRVALEHPPVPIVADIGIGYGTLAIGLVLNGVARSAIGTDVDALALWLAAENARINNVELALALTANPLDVSYTELTVCNVPTHISARDSAALMCALTERANRGYLLIVVHKSLADRYAHHLSEVGPMSGFESSAHAVLGCGRRSLR
jgi:16S rRNA G1207 methylase RsmC